MTNADKLHAAIEANEKNIPEFQKRVAAISSRIRGWSNVTHYSFFKSWLDAFPEAKSVLIVGVYLGRDIAFMLDAAGERPLRVTGVDKFNAEPCDDWPKEKLGMTWEEAFGCPPPDRDKAYENIAAAPHHTVDLIKANDKEWLEAANGAYDLCFYDASHDGDSVRRQIRQGHKLCHPFTIVAGDDYANIHKEWAVSDMVKESFRSHYHIDYRLWYTDSGEYL